MDSLRGAERYQSADQQSNPLIRCSGTAAAAMQSSVYRRRRTDQLLQLNGQFPHTQPSGSEIST